MLGLHVFEVCTFESLTSSVLVFLKDLSSCYLDANIAFQAVLYFACSLSLIGPRAFQVGPLDYSKGSFCFNRHGFGI
jgi:hypothetical protein